MKDRHISADKPIEVLRELFERVEQLEEHNKAIRRQETKETKSTGIIIELRVVDEKQCGDDGIRKKDLVKDYTQT